MSKNRPLRRHRSNFDENSMLQEMNEQLSQAREEEKRASSKLKKLEQQIENEAATRRKLHRKSKSLKMDPATQQIQQDIDDLKSKYAQLSIKFQELQAEMEEKDQSAMKNVQDYQRRIDEAKNQQKVEKDGQESRKSEIEKLKLKIEDTKKQISEGENEKLNMLNQIEQYNQQSSDLKQKIKDQRKMLFGLDDQIAAERKRFDELAGEKARRLETSKTKINNDELVMEDIQQDIDRYKKQKRDLVLKIDRYEEDEIPYLEAQLNRVKNEFNHLFELKQNRQQEIQTFKEMLENKT